MKRKLSDRALISSVSILPVLAIVLTLVWNPAATAQAGDIGRREDGDRRRWEDGETKLNSSFPPDSPSIHPLHPLQNPLPNSPHPSSFVSFASSRFNHLPSSVKSVTKSVAELPSSFPLTQSLPPAATIKQGRQISLNGRIIPLAWTQQPANSNSANIRTWIADIGLMQSAGVDLLNTADSTKQPVQWFSVSLTETQSLTTRITSQYRYLDVTDFARLAGWQISADGNTLRITSPVANVTGIRQAEREWGDRIVVDLDRASPWQVNIVDTPSPSPIPTDDPTKPAIDRKSVV